MEEFLGKRYALKSSDGLEEYLMFLDKGYFQRKAALSLKQENRLTMNDDGTYTFHFSSPLVSTKANFTSGVEFEETRPDGVKVKTIIITEDNKMTHTQTEQNGRISQHVRIFTPDSMTVITSYKTGNGEEKTATRNYILVE